MYPHIIIGSLHIASYSLMVLLGAIAYTLSTILILEKGEKVSPHITNRLLILSIFGFAVLGSSAFLLNSLFHSIEEKNIVFGGITWLGGVLSAFPAMLFLIHKFCPAVKGEALRYFELMTPGIVLAHAFGRVGCFLGGCCYGARTDSWLGVHFPAGSPAATQFPASDGSSLAVLPTQLIETIFELLLFSVMIIFFKKLKKYYLEIYCFGYGAFRFILEFWRGDDRGSSGLILSPSQIMSVILICGGILLALYRKQLIFKKLYAKMQKYMEERDSLASMPKNILVAMRQLQKMKKEQLITEEEFETKKEDLLKRL